MTKQSKTKDRLLLDARNRVSLTSFIDKDVIAVDVERKGDDIILKPLYAVDSASYKKVSKMNNKDK